MILYSLICAVLSLVFKRPFHRRYDGLPTLDYYHEDTYPDLSAKPFSFYSGKWLLRGFKYQIKGMKPQGIIVFFHGIGTGHFAYIVEIRTLAKMGYLVYAYDNTACGISEGPYLDSFSQAVYDQKAFFSWLDKDPDSLGLKRYVVGHSWGGYIALTSLQKKYNVLKVVSISGFDSLYRLTLSHFPKIRYGHFLAVGSQAIGYPKFGNLSGLKLLKKTSTPFLYIQGTADPMVPYADFGARFQKELADRPNTSFLFREGWGHQPYWTLESQKYGDEVLQPNRLSSYARDLDFPIDYSRFAYDDPVVIKTIIDFLAK